MRLHEAQVERERSTMKIRSLRNLVPVAVIIGIAFGCGTAAQAAATEAILMEQTLLNSGFKVQPAKTPAQRAQLRGLPDKQFTMINQNGNTYYLFPDKQENRLYAGDHYAYRAFQNFYKNNRLRAKGVVLFETNPADRSTNRTIQVWYDWTPFDQWR